MPESVAPTRRPPDLGGLALGTAGVTALVLAIIEGPSWGWSGATTLALFGAAAALLAAFRGVRGPPREPAARRARLLAPRVLDSGAAAISAAHFCLFGFIFLITQYFQLVRGYSALSAGVHTLPFAAVAMVATPLGAQLALRVGTRAVVGHRARRHGRRDGLGQPRSARDAAYVGPVVGSMMVMALGFSLINAPSTAAIMASLRPDQVGAGAAANETTRELGGTLGVAVIGSVFSSAFGPAARHAFASAGLRGATLDAAQRSMAVARATVAHLPAAARPGASGAVTRAFIDGLHRGCLVAGASVVAVGLVALATMPSRVTAGEGAPEDGLVTAVVP